jgi:opacity protein-like surface antigen
MIAQYNFALGNSFVLGLGVSVGLGSIKGGNINGVLPITFANNASVFLAPGFAISDSTQIYAKLAAISTSAEYNTTKLSLSGTGFGFGVQTFINKNVFITGEYMVNTLEDKKYTLNNETDKFSFNTLSIGVGYKF